MGEKVSFSGLEPFRHPKIPFLYIIEDKRVIPSVLNMVSGQKYGLETGFGGEPTRLFHVNPDIPWITTEPNKFGFHAFKSDISFYWEDLDLNLLRNSKPIIAINTASSEVLQTKAQTLVYRNLDYGDMFMVPYEKLKKGQRVVFIVDRLHAQSDELKKYFKYLKQYGYNPDLLQLRPKSLPPLVRVRRWGPHEYVLDVTKNSTSEVFYIGHLGKKLLKS